MSEKDFVFCVPFNSYSASENNGNVENDKGICVCKDSILGFDEYDFNEGNLKDITVNQILMSEGSAIFEAKQMKLSNLEVFEPFNITGMRKFHAWYSLIKLVTAGKISIDNLDVLTKSTQWIFNIIDGINCNLVLQIKSESIVKKLAQISFSMVENAELDLFELTNQLYLGFSKTNIKNNQLSKRCNELEKEISVLKSERHILDKILDERDRQTKAVIVELLNEKKKKILQLQEVIDKNNLGKLLPENTSDSEVINTHIVNAVTELNSPGTRRKSTKKDIDTSAEVYGSTKRKLKLEDSEFSQSLSKKPKTERDHEFAPEFNFYGISKTISNSEPKLILPTLHEPLVKVGTPDKYQMPDSENDEKSENVKGNQPSDGDSSADETDQGTDIEIQLSPKNKRSKVPSDNEEQSGSATSTEETDTDVSDN
ncbi:ligase interacting factor [Maudiozyma exigua]|uniref:Ligase interacting factor n=1 Tax=Maudiozyma exigua TaxID=34358 RepID=A0A9P6WCY5_MAUEX|nr:ligase interacting factor [Kazachstania exigua]